MDLTDLRVERVRTVLLGTRERVNRLWTQYVAVVAGALAVGGSAVVGVSTGQLAPGPAAAIAGAATGVVAAMLRAMVRLDEVWDRAVAESVTAIDTLIRQKGERDVDDEAADTR